MPIKPNPVKPVKNIFFIQWLLLGTALLLLGAVLGFNVYTDKQRIAHDEGQRILTQARVIARNMEFQFEASNLALQGILDDLPFLVKPENVKRANFRLTVLADAMPGIRTIFFTDAAGTILNANRAELVGKNIKYRDYFIEPLRHSDPEKLYISPPFKTVLGSYTFNITRNITDSDGNFAGVVTAGIDPDYFKMLLQSVLYAPDMIATINSGDGIRFMIIPQLEGQAGKNITAAGSMFTRHKQSGNMENIYSDIGYATGEYRMMALVTLDQVKSNMDKPPCIIAGRKVSEIMRPWQEDSMAHGLFFLLVCVASTAVLMLVQKRQVTVLQAESELAESRQQFVDIFNFMPDATFVVDQNKMIIAWNRAMELMTGVPKEEMLGQGDNAYTIPFYGERRPALVDMLYGDDEALEHHYPNVTRKGLTLFAETFCPALYRGAGAHIWATVAPLHDLGGNMTGAIESIRDISAIKRLEVDLKQSNELLTNQARIDFLTRIYNRLMFSELLLAELARSCRYETPVSIIMFDLDHFKHINDTLGHNCGDNVLKEVAGLVSSRLRVHDVFCRWGGEEFLILTPKNDATQAAQLAEVLRVLIAGHDFGDGAHVTASFGVTRHECGETPETLVGRVDAALYRAKNDGRNRVVTT